MSSYYAISKDFIIPAIIPFLIWFLTWYFGADKAEARKEEKTLEKNLNFLLSVSYASLVKLVQIKKTLEAIIQSEQTGFLEKALTHIIFPDVFSKIDISQYASCIKYSEEYLIHIARIQENIALISDKISFRGKEIIKYEAQQINYSIQKDIGNCKNLLENIKGTILYLDWLIQTTKSFEKVNKKLKLIDIKFYPEELESISEIKKGRNKDAKIRADMDRQGKPDSAGAEDIIGR